MTAEHSEDGCTEFVQRIVYLLDNELDAGDITEVRLHLDECAPCLERYFVQRTIKALVARSCAERAPETLRSRVLFSISEYRVEYREG